MSQSFPHASLEELKGRLNIVDAVSYTHLFLDCNAFMNHEDAYIAPISLKYCSAPGWNGTVEPVTACLLYTSRCV